MTTYDAIEKLYQLISKEMGPVEARETVSSILYVAIEEIQSEGKTVNAFSIEEKLQIEVNNFTKASTKDVA